jgi:hypothetical protein
MRVRNLFAVALFISIFSGAQRISAENSLSPLCKLANTMRNSTLLSSNGRVTIQVIAVGYPGEHYTVEVVDAEDPSNGSLIIDYMETDTRIYLHHDVILPHVGMSDSYTLPEEHELGIILMYKGVDRVTLKLTITCTPTVIAETVSNECNNISDGRLNSSPALDCAAPVAVYWSDAGLDVYSVNPDNGDGVFTVRLTQAEIDVAGEGNTLLAEIANPYTGDVVRVYKLAGGLIQINTTYADGKEYTIQFDGEGTLNHVAA